MTRQALFAAALFAACTLGQASADVILYDGTAGDDFFGSAPGGFRYNDIVVSDTGSSLIVDAPTDDGSNGLFGGLGRDVDPVATIDANTALFRIVYRPLADNTAGSFNFVLSDQDSPTSAQDYQFGITTSAGTPVGGGFVEQLIAITPGTDQFSAASFGFSAGDATVDYGLRQWQIQSGFGSPERLNIEIQSVSIVEPVQVPEPSSLAALMGLGVMGLVKRRR